MESLKVLNLSGNKFHTLDSDTFEHVIQLNTLILSNNPFDLFDLEAIRAIGQFSNLEELDLSRCRLSKLDERIFNPIKLAELVCITSVKNQALIENFSAGTT